MGNAILGALLIHDYKEESYLHWLLPACILVGVVGILAITLEAFKLQVGHTIQLELSVCSPVLMSVVRVNTLPELVSLCSTSAVRHV